jgi:hypothetical protein
MDSDRQQQLAHAVDMQGASAAPSSTMHATSHELHANGIRASCQQATTSFRQLLTAPSPSSLPSTASACLACLFECTRRPHALLSISLRLATSIADGLLAASAEFQYRRASEAALPRVNQVTAEQRRDLMASLDDEGNAILNAAIQAEVRLHFFLAARSEERKRALIHAALEQTKEELSDIQYTEWDDEVQAQTQHAAVAVFSFFCRTLTASSRDRYCSRRSQLR